MRFAGPGKNRPVHPADVVARLVRSCFPGLDTVAEHDRGMAAVTAADHLAADRELDAAEPCWQVETGTRCGTHLVTGGSPGRTIGGVGVTAPNGVPTPVTVVAGTAAGSGTDGTATEGAVGNGGG